MEATDVSAARMLEGNRAPAALAAMAKRRMRTKPLSLQQALEGGFSDHHRRLVSWVLGHIDSLDETMGQITAEVETRLEPHASKPEG
jgi:transposase